MISLLIALQIAPIAEMKSAMETVPVEEGVATFKRICFDPFPDPAASLAAIDSSDPAFTKSPKTPSQAMQPGDRWTSTRAEATYVDAAWLPIDFGAPQCSMTVALTGEVAHSIVAAALGSALALPATKFGKDGRSARTMWDVPQANGDKWRLFLTTTQTPSGTEMRTNIMNLRAKMKKK